MYSLRELVISCKPFQKVAGCSDDCLYIVKSGSVVCNKRLDIRALVQLFGSIQELWKKCFLCKLHDPLGEVFSKLVVDNDHWLVLGILPKVFIVVAFIFYLCLLKVSNKVRVFLLLTQSLVHLQKDFIIRIVKICLKVCVQNGSRRRIGLGKVVEMGLMRRQQSGP